MGILKVKVVKGRKLPATDIGGKSDPYCKLFLKLQEFKTKVINDNLDPVWDEEFTFEGLKEKKGILLVELWDKDLVYDDFIGSVAIRIEQIPDKFSDWLVLESKAKKQELGEVFIEIVAENF